jgi:hypothetical protein
MPRSKKIFFAFVALFVIVIGYLVYDISSHTTFPGSKPQPFPQQDSSKNDSSKSVHR